MPSEKHVSDYWRQLREFVRTAPGDEVTKWARGLSDAEIAAIPWWVVASARDKQIPPDGDWSLWLQLAGRGFGKTNTLSEFAHLKADAMPGSRGIIIAPTAGDARDVLIEGVSGILNTGPLALRPQYNPSKAALAWSNGTIAHIRSADAPDRLRGPQCHWFIADELAAWRYGIEAWDMLMFGFRLGDNPQGAIATTPKNCAVLREVMKTPGIVITRGTTFENRDNLPPVFFDRIVGKYEGTRIGRQELYAELLEDNPGALWRREWIDNNRVVKPPDDVVRVAVAMDPAATSGASADDCGIIGAASVGKRNEREFYPLDDATMHGTPSAQASAAVTLYHKLNADVLVVEKNNGGEWLETVIKQVDPKVRVKLISATRGKHTRAEPISYLYEQGRAHHVGTFPALEDELCQWEPGDKSPNRLDALVWACTELMSGGGWLIGGTN
jgi:phage terminase large subunit-like protein